MRSETSLSRNSLPELQLRRSESQKQKSTKKIKMQDGPEPCGDCSCGKDCKTCDCKDCKCEGCKK